MPFAEHVASPLLLLVIMFAPTRHLVVGVYGNMPNQVHRHSLSGEASAFAAQWSTSSYFAATHAESHHCTQPWRHHKHRLASAQSRLMPHLCRSNLCAGIRLPVEKLATTFDEYLRFAGAKKRLERR